MKAITKTAKKVMDKLTETLNRIGDHKTLHTEGYMDVVVEYIDLCDLGAMFSVVHYYKQNGDLMRDPEMCFIRGGGDYYPYYYRVDGLGIEQDALWVKPNGNVRGYDLAMQKEQTIFANTWLKNISQQQGGFRR